MRPDLAACYGQERLPRYTSYPTAPHFSTAIGSDTYAEWLKGMEGLDGVLSEANARMRALGVVRRAGV